ncbi:hypothetical protein [Escherichia coli]|uniref:hypothetical protein n=1 Tax=Escherichia coli TaxID=562 RepID=UPI0021589BB5|nr:hypothetical protein [Escherichia coli]
MIDGSVYVKKMLVILIMSIQSINCPLSYADWYIGISNVKPDVFTSDSLSWMQVTANSILSSTVSTGGTILYSPGCSNEESLGHYVYDYVVIPERIDLTPLSYIKVSFVNNSGWVQRPSDSGLLKYSRETLRGPTTSWNCGTYTTGSIIPEMRFERPVLNIKLELVDGGDLSPGEYISNEWVRTALVVANNNGKDSTIAMQYADNFVHTTSDNISNWIIKVNITPKCSVSTDSILLNHSVIAINDIAGNKATKTLTINCLAPTEITATVSGVDLLIGMPNNVTRCSTGLMCTISIGNNGSAKQVIKDVETVDLSVSNTLNKIENEQLVAGVFNGSGILTVTYQ